MEMSPANYSDKSIALPIMGQEFPPCRSLPAESRKNIRFKQAGLTLIEVLIALAIVSIALTAVIKAATQNIHSTAYLQKKTTAMWVGQQVINEMRAHILKVGSSSGAQKLTTEMLGNEWYWQTEEEETPNNKIKKVIVRVYENENEQAASSPVITLESYVHEE